MDPPYCHATEAYFRYLIRNYSGEGDFEQFGTSSRTFGPSSRFRMRWNLTERSRFSFSRELANAPVPEHQHYRLHFGRKWYCWCSDQGFGPFSPGSPFLLEERVIGAETKRGHASGPADPEKGPLLDSEVTALSNALRASTMKGTLTLQEQAAIWLALGLGSNPEPLALLREEDFWDVPSMAEGSPVFLLEVPRHKKGHAVPRTEFVERRLNPEIGEVLLALFNQNRTDHPLDDSDSDGRPLFRRQRRERTCPRKAPVPTTATITPRENHFSAMVTRADREACRHLASYGTPPEGGG